MKTFDRRDVYSWANCENAKEYIGKKGYFGGDLDELTKQINENKLYTLNGVDSNSATLCFVTCSYVGKWSSSLFLPIDKVKEVEEEKEYRPFKNFNEFNVVTNKSVGDLINYKLKNTSDFYCAVITKTFCSPNLEPTIDFGNSYFKYTELFKNFVWLDSENTWKPFGVEV